MSEITDWAGGKPCERHDLAFCADCRDLAKIVARSDGSLGYKSDCAVSTFCELTGASYDEGVEIMRKEGFAPGGGTPHEGVKRALESAGYTVRRVRIDPNGALMLSAHCGISYYVHGEKSGKGHAWSISKGVARRAFRPPYRYFVYEVKPS